MIKGHRIEGYRTRVHTIQEGWDLCCAIMAKGHEGVQNDSSRYNDLHLKHAFRQKDYCWVGVFGNKKTYEDGSGYLRVINVHDKVGRKYLKDVGKSKFAEILGLDIRKRDLPRSLRNLSF